MSTVLSLLLSILLLLLLKKCMDYWTVTRSIRDIPGTRFLISPFGLFGLLFPDPIPWLCPGSLRSWYYKHEDFGACGADIISTVSVFPTSEVVLQVADPATVKEINIHRSRFPKSVYQYGVLSFFGPNIVISENEQWKHFRKLIAPAFSDLNNRVVWDESIRVMQDLFDNMWGTSNQVTVDDFTDVTFAIALFVLSVAAFGQRITWKEDVKLGANHKMSFKNALHTAALNAVCKIATPQWILKYLPTRHMRAVNLAYEELERYMWEIIGAYRTGESNQASHDLLSGLVGQKSDGTPQLKNDELLGNLFIFLLAGHETAAHTLSFAFGLLALYPELQEELYQQIKSVLPDGEMPRYDNMSLLTGSLSVLYETLRLFPPAHSLPKCATEDTIFTTTNHLGQEVKVPCPKGTTVILHIPGLHYNPSYWSDPHVFNPGRFRGDWPKDAFLPFSSGPRACLGRRFFEAEGVAILTMLVMKYKVNIKDEPQFAGETFESRKERILRTKPGLTLSPLRMPLVFTKRNHQEPPQT